jgi:hypothetical protein
LNAMLDRDNVGDNGHSSTSGSSLDFKTSTSGSSLDLKTPESNSDCPTASHNRDDMDDNVSGGATRTEEVADSTPLPGGIAKSTARWNCPGPGTQSELATSPSRERGRSEPNLDESRNTTETTDLTMSSPESQEPNNNRKGDIAAQDDLVDSDGDEDMVLSWKRGSKTPENDSGASAMAMVASIAADPYVASASSSTIDRERAESPRAQRSKILLGLGTSSDSQKASSFLPALDPHCFNYILLASGGGRKKRAGSPAKILAGSSIRGFVEGDDGFDGDKLRSRVVENSTKDGTADPSALSESFFHFLDSLCLLILCSHTLLNATLQRRRFATRRRTLLLVQKFSLSGRRVDLPVVSRATNQ